MGLLWLCSVVAGVVWSGVAGRSEMTGRSVTLLLAWFFVACLVPSPTRAQETSPETSSAPRTSWG